MGKARPDIPPLVLEALAQGADLVLDVFLKRQCWRHARHLGANRPITDQAVDARNRIRSRLAHEGIDDHLQRRPGVLRQHIQQGLPFGIIRLQGRDRTVLAVMIQQVGRHAQGTCGQRFIQHGTHALHLVNGCGALPGFQAHHHQANREMPDKSTVVRRHLDLAGHGRLVLRPAAPVPGQVFQERCHRDILEEGENIDHLHAHCGIIRNRRGSETAVAENGGGYAIARQRIKVRLPPHVGIEVGMGLDEAGGDVAAAGVYHLLIALGLQATRHLHNAPVTHAHIRRKRGGTGAINNHPARNQGFIIHIIIPQKMNSRIHRAHTHTGTFGLRKCAVNAGLETPMSISNIFSSAY